MLEPLTGESVAVTSQKPGWPFASSIHWPVAVEAPSIAGVTAAHRFAPARAGKLAALGPSSFCEAAQPAASAARATEANSLMSLPCCLIVSMQNCHSRGRAQVEFPSLRASRCHLAHVGGLALVNPLAPSPAQLGLSTIAAPAARPQLPPVVRSEEAARLISWIEMSDDNGELPYIVIDKQAAALFLFDADGKLVGETPVLLGMAAGDDSTPGIGSKSLATIGPAERTTPAGRFVAKFGFAAGASACCGWTTRPRSHCTSSLPVTAGSAGSSGCSHPKPPTTASPSAASTSA